MKKILLAITCLSSLSVFADDAMKDDGKNFEEKKSMMLSFVEQRIANLNEHKTCIQAASDKEALKACHVKFKDEREELKTGLKNKREEWKANKKK